MSFVLRLAWRETRASWQRLVFFFLCIALGVAAIASLRSVVQVVRHSLGAEARVLLAGDVAVTSGREWTPSTLAVLDQRLAGIPEVTRTEMLETPTMVRAAGSGHVRMAEVRGVGPEFPLYGTVRLAGGQRYRHSLLENRGALVRPDLLEQLEVGIGDLLFVGGEPFEIRGVIELEPASGVGGFRLGSRVLIDREALTNTALLGFGSRVRRQILLKLPDAQVEKLTDTLRDDLKNEFVSVRSYRTTDSDIGEDLARAEDYLSLVGLIVAILGGIGVASVTRTFIEQKIRTLAILKCVGASTRQTFAAYLLQAGLLGIAGAAVGLLVARLILAALPLWVGPGAGLPSTIGLTTSAAFQAAAVGVLVAILFAIVPLLRIRHVKPALLLRAELPPPPRRDLFRWAVTALVSAALVLLVVWQVGSWRVGATVAIGFALVLLVLHVAGVLLVWMLRPLAASRTFALRHAVLRTVRPGNQTRTVLLAIGLGAFFVTGVRFAETNLLEQFRLEGEGADMFLIDVQSAQVGLVKEFLATTGARLGVGTATFLPVLRARVTGVQGRRVQLENYEDVRGRGGLGREYTLTYRAALAPNERLVAGQFWEGPSSTTPEVSIEESIRERFRIDVGDRIRFDVLGGEIEATVTSVRAVNWRDVRAGGFMFVFRPGVFETAPHTFIAPLAGPGEPARRAALQRELVARFPNVSVIDVREVMTTIRRVIDRLTTAVTVVGGLVLFSGLLILGGAVAVTRFRRTYEAAILRTLGASSRTLAFTLLVEYGLLGALAAVIGTSGGLALSWAVARFVLRIDWVPLPGLAAVSVAAITVLVAVVGMTASADVLRRKPLAALRAE